MPTVADLVRPGTALPGIANRMQIRGFCARWHPIVIAANECVFSRSRRPD
jgi:hypothetical protein